MTSSSRTSRRWPSGSSGSGTSRLSTAGTWRTAYRFRACGFSDSIRMSRLRLLLWTCGNGCARVDGQRRQDRVHLGVEILVEIRGLGSASAPWASTRESRA